jgi:hypothetical protein
MREPLQIEREAPTPRPAVEPGCKFAGVMRGELVVPVVPGKIDNRRGAKSAVKVVMQEDFGNRLQDIFRDFHTRR